MNTEPMRDFEDWFEKQFPDVDLSNPEIVKAKKNIHFGWQAALNSQANLQYFYEEVNALCQLICNSPADTVIKGEIESRAFALGHFPKVLNSKGSIGSQQADKARELEKAMWVLKQIANLDPKNAGLIGTAVFMAQEAIEAMKGE